MRYNARDVRLRRIPVDAITSLAHASKVQFKRCQEPNAEQLPKGVLLECSAFACGRSHAHLHVSLLRVQKRAKLTSLIEICTAE
eukprot:2928469-Pleurochrysis_carterae.AAC.3